MKHEIQGRCTAGVAEGVSAVFPARIMLMRETDVEVTVPKGFTVVAKSGAEARLMNDVVFFPGSIVVSGVFEVVKPSGLQGNGLWLAWDPITRLPFVAGVRQEEISSGGSNPENDKAFMQTIMQEPEGSERALAAAEALIVMTLPHGEPDNESLPEYGEVLV